MLAARERKQIGGKMENEAISTNSLPRAAPNKLACAKLLRTSHGVVQSVRDFLWQPLGPGRFTGTHRHSLGQDNALASSTAESFSMLHTLSSTNV